MKFLVWGIALAISSAVAIANPLPEKPHVYVEGSAYIEVEPDEMEFTIEISHRAKNLEQAKEKVDERSATLLELCHEAGILKEDISSSALRVSPSYTYRNDRRVPDGTTVSRDVHILLKDLEKYPQVMNALVEADISESVETKLKVSESSNVLDEALIKALEDATQRASKMAASQGKKLGEAHSISEFMTRGEERYMLQVSRNIYGNTSNAIQVEVARYLGSPSLFEPGVMQARAQVFVVFLLK